MDSVKLFLSFLVVLSLSFFWGCEPLLAVSGSPCPCPTNEGYRCCASIQKCIPDSERCEVAGLIPLPSNNPTGESGGSPIGGVIQKTSNEAWLVGLGESVATSGGINQLKVKWVRELIAKYGFRVVAFASPWKDADAVETYLQQPCILDSLSACERSCEDDTRTLAAMNGLWSTLSDKNIQTLLVWMCQFNLTHPNDSVHVMGYDVIQPWHDADFLDQFLTLVSPENTNHLLDPIRNLCEGAGSNTTKDTYEDSKAITVESFRGCIQALNNLETFLTVEGPGLIQRSGGQPSLLELAQLSLVSLNGWEAYRYYDKNGLGGWSFKEHNRAMAEILLALSSNRFPGSKVILWDSNLRVAANHGEITSFTNTGGPFESLGSILRKRLGLHYQAIAFTAYDISMNLPNIAQGRLKLPGNDFLETTIKTLWGDNPDACLIDFSQKNPLEANKTYRMISDSQDNPSLVPNRQFESVVFLTSSSAMESVFGWDKPLPQVGSPPVTLPNQGETFDARLLPGLGNKMGRISTIGASSPSGFR